MRFTKKVLKERKQAMRDRVADLCIKMHVNDLKAECERLSPGVTFDGNPWEMMQHLLLVMLDDNLPDIHLD